MGPGEGLVFRTALRLRHVQRLHKLTVTADISDSLREVLCRGKCSTYFKRVIMPQRVRKRVPYGAI